MMEVIEFGAVITAAIYGIMLVSMFVPRIPERFKVVLHLPDAIGMGMFSVVGTQYALDEGTTWFIASLFGVMTGCFGGVISEIISNEVPSIFRSAPLYATCSFAGCWCYLCMSWLGVVGPVCIVVAVLVIVAMRLAALYWDLRLPEYSE